MNPDTFICGTCKHQFNDVGMYMSHKEMCNMANQTCNYVADQPHVNNTNQHCAVSGHLGSLHDPPMSAAPVHHDHAYFHYEAPGLVASDVPSSSQQQSNSGLLMDMLSSLDGSQMTPTFTEPVVEDFMPPPQQDQHMMPVGDHLQHPQMHQAHPQMHHQNINQQPMSSQSQLQPQTDQQQHQNHLQQHQSHFQQHQSHPHHSQNHIQASNGHMHQNHLQQDQAYVQQPQNRVQQSCQLQPNHFEPSQNHMHQHQSHVGQPQDHLHQPHMLQTQGHVQQTPNPMQHPQQTQLSQHQMQHSHGQQHQHPQAQPQNHLLQNTIPQHQPMQNTVSHPQPMQNTVSHPQPMQNTVSHPQHQPMQNTVSQHQPMQNTVSHPQPMQNTVSHPQPMQNTVSHPQPMQNDVSQRHATQSHIPPQQVHCQPAVASVYNPNVGVPATAAPPPITGGYLAAVQRSEPLLVVGNGVLTYVSPGMLDSSQAFQAPADAPAELTTSQGQPSSEAPRAPKESEGRGSEGCGQLIARMATPRLQCLFCRRRFRRNFDLQMHARTHTGEKPFQCVVCGRAFAQRCNVKRHMESHKVWPTAGPGTLPDIHTFEVRLAENRQLIVRPTKSIDHVMERREYRVLYGRSGRSGANAEASVASKSRSTEETLVLVDNCWECRFCRSRFEDFQKLRSHMRQHSDQQVYLCVLSDCRQTFKQMDAFLEHLEAHQQKKEMVYVCHVCQKTFVTVQELGEHYNNHCKDPTRPKQAGEKASYKCPECGHTFRRPAALQAHMLTAHAGGPAAFTCSYCDKTFASEASLRHHIPLHGSLATFQCSRCPKAFKTRQYLRVHERTEHERKSPFSCSRCNRGFLSRPALRTHVVSVHEPHRKLKCPLAAATGCTFETASASAVASHLASHSRHLRRPCPCSHCGCRFANALLLRRHLKKHRAAQRRGAEGGELRCECCGRAFLRRGPFENHEKLCRQIAAQRERRRRRREEAEAAPKAEVAAEARPESAPQEAVTEGRPQRRRKFTAFWKPKRRRKKRAVEEAEEEASEEEERDVYDPLRAIIGCPPACSSGPSLPGIATFNQAITADHLDIAGLVRAPNQNAPYTCSEDLKLLDVGDQFEENRSARSTSDQQGVSF